MVGSKNGGRLTRIERLLAKLNAQTNDLHRLAVLNVAHQAAPEKPAKRRAGKKR